MDSDRLISEEGRDERVLLIGGKGGVGKTTCSAAIASRILDNLIDVEALDKTSQHQLLDYIGSAPSCGKIMEDYPEQYALEIFNSTP